MAIAGHTTGERNVKGVIGKKGTYAGGAKANTRATGVPGGPEQKVKTTQNNNKAMEEGGANDSNNKTQPKPENLPTNLEQLLKMKVPTPIQVDKLSQLLIGYDPELRDYLIQGLTQGFKLEIDDGSFFLNKEEEEEIENHDSANRHSDHIDKKVEKELAAARILGPYEQVPFDNHKISPLAATEKKQPGEYRLIHDLSHPKGAGVSVNDNIEVEKGKVKYQSMDNVIDTIAQLGPNTWLAVFDVEHAYKVLPIHPSDVPKMGFKWDEAYYFDRTLAMGCRTSAKIFEAFTTALEWIMRNKFNLKYLHHVLDDFLLLVNPAVLAQKQMEIFKKVCAYLGIPLKIVKLKSGFIVIYLGIELDTIKMEARLPLEKVEKCRNKIRAVLEKGQVQREELESLAGLLNFACRVVRPGRTFMRRLYDAIYSVPSKYKHIKIKPKLRADLKMWWDFMESYNGVTLFPEKEWRTSEILHCYTDACPEGYGLVFGQSWLYGLFPKTWAKLNIMALEAFPVMLLFELWGEELANKKLLLRTDNQSLETVLNTKTSRHPETMTVIRHITLLAMKHNIVFKAKHIRGVDNVLADPLSRFQVDIFKRRIEGMGRDMESIPTHVPEHLLPENYKII